MPIPSWYPPVPQFDEFLAYVDEPHIIEWENWRFWVQAHLDWAEWHTVHEANRHLELMIDQAGVSNWFSAFRELRQCLWNMRWGIGHVRNAVWYMKGVDRWLRYEQAGRMPDAEIFDAVVRETKKRW